MTNASRQKVEKMAGSREGQPERVIREFVPVIKSIAHRLAYRLPAHLDADDLISVGIMGLLDALRKYDPTRAAKFKTYAEFRIRGAMLDEIRSMDWVPRSVHERIDVLRRTKRDLLNRHGRPPTDEELAAALTQSVGEFAAFLNLAQRAVMISLDDVCAQGVDDHRILGMLIDSEHPDPLSTAITGDVRRLLVKTIQQLPEKERLVLSLYYYEDFTMKEVGGVLNVTESRVCQIHSKAIAFLKAQLEGAR